MGADPKSADVPSFEIEIIQSYLTKYIEEVAQLDVMSKNTLKSPLILENDTLIFELANPLEKDKVEQEKAALVNYLRSVFHKNDITIDYSVNVNSGSGRPYTPKEKFEAMIEKNPELAKLRDKLGLDTDY